jgi:hypothetical protein
MKKRCETRQASHPPQTSPEPLRWKTEPNRLGTGSPPVLLWLALLLSFNSQLSNGLAQPYVIDRYTIDGGGGAITGGVFRLTATIGQHDAGPTMTNGGFALTGGFWAGMSVLQTPGAPLLSIFRTATNTVVVSWTSPSTNFSLKVNTNLTTTNWTATEEPTDNGTNKFIIVNPPLGGRFYRLSQP